jgi:hypothetical protein
VAPPPAPYATAYGYNVASRATGFKYGNGIYVSFGFSPDRLQLSCLDYSTINRNGNCAHDSTALLTMSGIFFRINTYKPPRNC